MENALVVINLLELVSSDLMAGLLERSDLNGKRPKTLYRVVGLSYIGVFNCFYVKSVG